MVASVRWRPSAAGSCSGTCGSRAIADLAVDVEVDAPILEIAVRYRPNLVINTPPGYPAYTENEWTGHTRTVGEARLRAMSATPRCVIPTLEHGLLPRAPHALRTPAAENRVEALGLGVLPCVGTYLEVPGNGTIRISDPVRLD